jgi:hypothetical protein
MPFTLKIIFFYFNDNQQYSKKRHKSYKIQGIRIAKKATSFLFLLDGTTAEKGGLRELFLFHN